MSNLLDRAIAGEELTPNEWRELSDMADDNVEIERNGWTVTYLAVFEEEEKIYGFYWDDGATEDQDPDFDWCVLKQYKKVPYTAYRYEVVETPES